MAREPKLPPRRQPDIGPDDRAVPAQRSQCPVSVRALISVPDPSRTLKCRSCSVRTRREAALALIRGMQIGEAPLPLLARLVKKEVRDAVRGAGMISFAKSRVVPTGTYGETAREILLRSHPDLQGMARGEIRLIEPIEPLRRGESRFLLIDNDVQYEALEQWSNRPSRGRIGGGWGFSELDEKPIFVRENRKVRVPDADIGSSTITATKKFLDLLLACDANGIAYVPISRTVEGEGAADEESFLIDIIRKIPAIDWGNSQVRAECRRAVLPPHADKISLTVPLGLRIRPDIPEDVHIFRDEQLPSTVFASRELLKRLEAEGATGICSSDPAGALAK